MRLCVFRHGIAIDRMDSTCPADPERMLTPRGIERTRLAARGLAWLGVEAEAVYSSPYRRARETAELACEALPLAPIEIRESDTLLPFGYPEEFLQLLARDNPASALCTGHRPHLDELVSAALGADFTFCSLKKAGAALIEWNPDGGGELLWLYTPKVLRALGGEPR